MHIDIGKQFAAIGGVAGDILLVDYAVQGIEQEHRRKARIVDGPGILPVAAGQERRQIVDQDVARQPFAGRGGAAAKTR